MVAFDMDTIHANFEDKYATDQERLDHFPRKLERGNLDYDRIAVKLYDEGKSYEAGRDEYPIYFKTSDMCI